MRFLSVYKSVETGVPPTQEEMATMGKLIEKWMKAGFLLSAEGCLPSAKGARVRLWYYRRHSWKPSLPSCPIRRYGSHFSR